MFEGLTDKANLLEREGRKGEDLYSKKSENGQSTELKILRSEGIKAKG